MESIQILSRNIAKEELVRYFNKTKNDFTTFNDSSFVEEYANKLSDNASFVVCHNSTNQIIGVIAAYMNRPPICYISHVCVIDGYKRLGLYTKMMYKLEKDALENKCNKLCLEVRKDNTRAMNAYLKTGFVITGTGRDGFVLMEKSI